MLSVAQKYNIFFIFKVTGAVTPAVANAGANSKCTYIYHDPNKPEALKELKIF